MKFKAIRLKLYQPSANYRKPYDFGSRESYPLPPYSTVIGMIHNLCGFTEYHSMKLSISGTYASTHRNMFKAYSYGSIPKGRTGVIDVQGQQVACGVSHVQVLDDINLVIHIMPEDSADFDVIYNALKHPREYPSLGRHEDDAIFKSVDIVSLDNKELDEDMDVEAGFYIPVWDIDKLDLTDEDESGVRGTSFKINKNYELVKHGKQVYRDWHRIPVLYASGFTIDEGEEALVDQDNLPVMFA